MSDSENEVEKTTFKSPTFGNNWGTFKSIFLNYAECKGFASVVAAEDLDPNPPVGQHVFSEEADIQKKEKKAVKKNQIAIKTLFNAICKARQTPQRCSKQL